MRRPLVTITVMLLCLLSLALASPARAGCGCGMPDCTCGPNNDCPCGGSYCNCPTIRWCATTTDCGAYVESSVWYGGVSVCKDVGCGGSECCDCGAFKCASATVPPEYEPYPCACWYCSFAYCRCSTAGGCGYEACTSCEEECSYSSCVPCTEPGECGHSSCE